MGSDASGRGRSFKSLSPPPPLSPPSPPQSLSPSPSLHALRAHLYVPHVRRMAAWLDADGFEFDWKGTPAKIWLLKNGDYNYPTIQYTGPGMGRKSRTQLTSQETINDMWAMGRALFMSALTANDAPAADAVKIREAMKKAARPSSTQPVRIASTVHAFYTFCPIYTLYTHISHMHSAHLHASTHLLHILYTSTHHLHTIYTLSAHLHAIYTLSTYLIHILSPSNTPPTRSTQHLHTRCTSTPSTQFYTLPLHIYTPSTHLPQICTPPQSPAHVSPHEHAFSRTVDADRRFPLTEALPIHQLSRIPLPQVRATVFTPDSSQHHDGKCD